METLKELIDILHDTEENLKLAQEKAITARNNETQATNELNLAQRVFDAEIKQTVARTENRPAKIGGRFAALPGKAGQMQWLVNGVRRQPPFNLAVKGEWSETK